jgi:hypothetical protein
MNKLYQWQIWRRQAYPFDYKKALLELREKSKAVAQAAQSGV